MQIAGYHHVALRCEDADETVAFYAGLLGMDLVIVTRETTYRDKPLDFLHLFFRMGDGSFLAFFEVPSLKPSIPDPNTPHWVNHIACTALDRAAVETIKAKLEKAGTAVEGPVTRPPFHSIYFTDPNGHRIEVTALDPVNDGRYRPDAAQAQQVLADWRRDKGAGLNKA